MKSLLKDPDIARLFENTFPNTLGWNLIVVPSDITLIIPPDTTVKYFSKVIYFLCLKIVFVLKPKRKKTWLSSSQGFVCILRLPDRWKSPSHQDLTLK